MEKDELEEKFVDLRNSQYELEQQLYQLQQSIDSLKTKSGSPEDVNDLAVLSGGKWSYAHRCIIKTSLAAELLVNFIFDQNSNVQCKRSQ